MFLTSISINGYNSNSNNLNEKVPYFHSYLVEDARLIILNLIAQAAVNNRKIMQILREIMIKGAVK